MNLKDLKKETDQLKFSDKMPLLFIGHGSPMNGIEDNIYSQHWNNLVNNYPVPKAVLCVSAHWLTKGTHITAMENPKTIHDFGGFPNKLYEVQYPAPGDPSLAEKTQQLITKTDLQLNHDWGLDHGTWTVVRHMYPEAKVPVLQLSIDYYKPAVYHYELAKELSSLRKKGVLIIGSGNLVHNLKMIAFDKINEPEYGYDWAIEINEVFKNKLLSGNHKDLINYQSLHSASKMAIPTPDHYYPLIYTLGLQEKSDEIKIFNDNLTGGSISMTSVEFR